jgi:hypothetical protein
MFNLRISFFPLLYTLFHKTYYLVGNHLQYYKKKNVGMVLLGVAGITNGAPLIRETPACEDDSFAIGARLRHYAHFNKRT